MKNTEQCTGCFACADVCPLNCITLTQTDEGFYVPQVDWNLCVHCGRCDVACEHAWAVGNNRIMNVYASQNKNAEILKRSSSGGVFYSLASYILDSGGVVFGAAMDQRFVVVHQMASDRESLQPLLGSKYVQSKTIGIYRVVKSCLKQNRKVLFAGSPCQAAALCSVVGKEDPNLFIIDFVCHGVPSPKIWQQYIAWVRSQYGEKITEISFRDKALHGWNHFALSFFTREKTIFSEDNHENIFMQLFLRNKILRRSCYQCPYKGFERHSDLTLADYWGGDRYFPETREAGISAILTNSEKGSQLLDCVKDEIRLKPASLKEFAITNRSLVISADMPKDRRSTVKKICDTGFDGSDRSILKTSGMAIIQNKLRSTFIRIRLQIKLRSWEGKNA